MDCPRCRLMLRETEYESVKADICDNCWGMWLDRGELEEILNARQMSFSAEERRQFKELRGASTAPTPAEGEPGAPCPRCGQAMEVIGGDAELSLAIDRCPKHGVWLDPGEIKAVQVAAERSGEFHELLLRMLGLRPH